MMGKLKPEYMVFSEGALYGVQAVKQQKNIDPSSSQHSHC